MEEVKKAPIIPVVGMGATMPSGSDSYPYTIVSVKPNLKEIEICRCNHKRIDNNGAFTEDQEYEYSEVPNASRERVKLYKHGWKTVSGKSRVLIGFRRYHQDPHF